MSLIATIIYAIWLLSELLLNRLLRAKAGDQPGADKNSEGFIWLTVLVSITVAVFIRYNIACMIMHSPLIGNIGLAVIVIGVLLRLIAVASLGRFFTVNVTIRKDHQLKQDGVYAYLRHPSYAASLLTFIGFGLSLNNWISLAIVTIAILFAFIVRIRVEERVLIARFGETYINYKKKTKALIPFVY